jgi:hypothetical protein
MLIVTGSATVSAADDFPYGKSLDFSVFRNGQQIGRHTLSFQHEGGNRTVTVSVNFAVKALGLVAYRYTHNAKEVWSGSALQSLASTTDDNGRKFAVRIQRGANGLMVERVSPPNTMPVSAADQGTVVMPPEIKHEVQPFSMLPTSNWNMGQVAQSVLLNTQYGIPFHTQIKEMGREPIRTASGATIEATRYHYTGDLRMDQWFDSRGRWVKASFPAPDGSVIEYVLQE